jgi:hypothetical protein
MLDPDPDEMNADPHPWPFHIFSILLLTMDFTSLKNRGVDTGS